MLKLNRITPAVFIFALLLSLCSCTDDLLEIDEYESQIVIDGWIEQGRTPIVTVTKSMSYFTDLNQNEFRDLLISDAKVTVSDGSMVEILTLKSHSNLFPSYVYEGNKLRGEVGKTYSLKVEYGGKIATSKTSIPKPIKLDSVWFQLAEDKKDLGLIWIKFTDNSYTKDYYKAITQEYKTGSNIISNLFSIFDDKYFSGQTIETPLYNHNTNIIRANNDMYFHKGDSVHLKFTTIDEVSYTFWYSYTKEILNGQNPFAATNSKVQSNIKNGLGIWCGYGINEYVVYNK